MPGRHRLERTQIVAAPRSEVFEFFSAARNLQILTPPFLNFQIVTPEPIQMTRNTHIEYRIALGGVPMRWLTEISVWEPNERFVDSQLSGPYSLWHHLHEFRDSPNGTEMRDVVDYELPFGVLGGLTHALFVKRTLQRIFDYREEAIARVFSQPGPSGASRSPVGVTT
jgi:ligand-binding SRPBCC domain-containing protein